MKRLLFLTILIALSCSKSNDEQEEQTSVDCLIEANFSGIIYSNGCINSYAESNSENKNKLFIESIGSDRKMSGTFYLNNFEIGNKEITESFYLTWDIGGEGYTSPSTQLDNIEFEITENTASTLSGNCMVPFDDEGFIVLDTLWMNFQDIVIIE